MLKCVINHDVNVVREKERVWWRRMQTFAAVDVRGKIVLLKHRKDVDFPLSIMVESK